MNVLFIADIHSKSHNLKWILHLTRIHQVKSYILCSKSQMERATSAHVHFLKENGVVVLKPIHDYSTINILRTLRDCLIIKRQVRKHSIDIIHVMYAEPNALWALWKRRFGKPLVLTTRGTDVLHTIPSFFKRKDFFGKIIQWEYKQAFGNFSAITCTSKSQEESVLKIGANKTIHLVRTGVDYDKIDEAELDMKKHLGISKEMILMPRSMLPLYNHEFTLAAIELFNEEILKKFTFVFVNSDTTDQAYFKKMKSKAESIDSDIRFFPSFKPSEIYSLYKQSKLVVMSPISDGSAVSAMEAMACKSPVILPPLAYDEDIFGNHVFQFQKWKAEELKNLIFTVLEMPLEIMDQGLNKAQNHIRKNFTLESQMSIVNSIYLNLMEKDQNVQG